jgi:DNA-binding transcriptional MerR regulator
MPDLPQITFDFSEASPEPPSLAKRSAVPAKAPKGGRGRRSLKEAEADGEGVQVPEDAILFSKQYYPIGEVAAMFAVNVSLLRHWEGEFGMDLRKNKKGDRFFRPEEIKLLLVIHDLLRRRKFTIEGAKDYIKGQKAADRRFEMIQSLQRLKGFLHELKAHL